MAYILLLFVSPSIDFRLICLFHCTHGISSPTVRDLQSPFLTRTRTTSDDATTTIAPGSTTATAASTWGVSYDTKKLLKLISDRLPSYEIITSNLRGQMRMYVLALKNVVNEIVDVRVAGENTGLGSVLANKV